MGLSFSHGDFTMTYRGFNNLLCELAKEAGIRLEQMEGYGGNRSWDEISDDLKHLYINRDEYGGGVIDTYACLWVKRRIQDIISVWQYKPAKKPPNLRRHAMKLAEALSEAAFKGERFEWF